MLEQWERNWQAGGDAHFAICRGEVVLGGAGLHRREADGLAIGYWVDRDHLNQGVATTAARALTDLGFTVPGIAWVDIHHDLSTWPAAEFPRSSGTHDWPTSNGPAISRRRIPALAPSGGCPATAGPLPPRAESLDETGQDILRLSGVLGCGSLCGTPASLLQSNPWPRHHSGFG